MVVVRLPAPGHADDRGRYLRAIGSGRHLRRHVACRFLDRQSVADGAGISVGSWSTTPSHDREMYRNLGMACGPIRRRWKCQADRFHGAVISLSLIAAFTPLFHGWIVGRLLREFSLTLTFAIVVSPWCRSRSRDDLRHYIKRRPPAPRLVRRTSKRVVAHGAFYTGLAPCWVPLMNYWFSLRPSR